MVCGPGGCCDGGFPRRAGPQDYRNSAAVPQTGPAGAYGPFRPGRDGHPDGDGGGPPSAGARAARPR